MGSAYHVNSAFRHFPSDESCVEYRALSMIAKSVQHPQRTLLSVFVQQAADKEAAAQLFLDFVADRGTTAVLDFLAEWIELLEKVQPVVCDDLQSSVKETVWQRDSGRCCISGIQLRKDSLNVTFVYPIPPSFFSSKDSAIKGIGHSLLAAFLGEVLLKNLCSFMKRDSEPERHCSSQVILLSRSVFKSYRDGRVALQSPFKEPTDYSGDYITQIRDFLPIKMANIPCFIKLENGAPGQASLPFRKLLEAHRHLAESLTWVKVLQYMEERDSRRGKPTSRAISKDATMSHKASLGQWRSHTLSRIWISLPASMRAYIYKQLARVSHRLYGSTGSDSVYKLPFNLHLRMSRSTWDPKHKAEARSLQLLERYTNIPAPRALDAVEHSKSSFLLVTGLPGEVLGHMLPTMTDEQVDTIVQDLKDYLAQLRHIPRAASPEFPICNAIGGGILDWRISDSKREELLFRDEDGFNPYLIDNLPLDEEMSAQISRSHCIEHDIVFTHGDLNMRNIIVDENNKISGIVDW